MGISVTTDNTATVNGILWDDNTLTVSCASAATVTGQNQHTGDPALGTDGYHLTAGSAAINRGIDAGILDDIDGEPRPDCIFWDIGADEVQGLPCWRVRLPLVLRQYP